MGAILITGASSGLGRAIALALHHDHTLLCLGRSAERLQEAGVLCGEFVPIDFVKHTPLDVTDTVRELAGKYGGLDGMVHCAGEAGNRMPMRHQLDSTFDRGMSFAASTFAMLRAACKPNVMEDGASVVVASSVAASRGCKGLGVYAAARAASEAMVRTVAVELASRRVRVNAVAYGAFESAMHLNLTRAMTPSSLDAYKLRHPLGFGTCEAAAATVLHLLSPAAAWTTGTTVVVDGGYSLL